MKKDGKKKKISRNKKNYLIIFRTLIFLMNISVILKNFSIYKTRLGYYFIMLRSKVFFFKET